MRERPDLSVPQVAGSALAAVLAAKLASSFGVYGTILGAGVVSVIATCGGSLFQHFFKRTGEQLREATTTAGSPEPAPASAPGEYSAGTVHRARGRGLRRPVLAAVLVFGVTMTGITAYELASGSSFSGGGGTTVSDAVSGHGSSAGNSGAPTDSTSPSRSADPSPDPGNTPSPGPSGAADGGAQAPSPSPGEPSGEPRDPAPSATPSPATGAAGATPAPSLSATAPAPAADSRSGTADQDPADPAAR
ncbi:hypothetical protein PV682_01630 [Streptomyces niveiscabiei]|nr:hypothetical protein [Streptomyces niveiscabiei]